jgi:hypothetical protein
LVKAASNVAQAAPIVAEGGNPGETVYPAASNPPFRPGPMRSWSLLILAAMLPAASRAADPLLLEELGVRQGMVTATVRLSHGFDAETRTSIERGLPITVRYTVELWRKRSLWFDKQLDSRVRAFRVRYDPGEKLYSVSGADRYRVRETFQSLDAALERLSPRVLDVHPRAELQDGSTYYVVVEMAIQPLTVEEFRELDGWISGRIRGEGEAQGPADGAETGDGGVSGALFGFLIDLAGFGDKILEAETPGFRPAALPELPDGP